MQIIQATSGKVGANIIGPKYFLKTNIRLGEIALCIAREIEPKAPRPSIWAIGGISQITDYVSIGRLKNLIDNNTADMLLNILQTASKNKPSSALNRLASVFNIENLSELQEMLQLAQVYVSSPIDGIQDFSISETKPKWISKTNI